ncbi:MAG: hypothetical protein ABH821_01545 [archaeon]
MEEKKKYKIVLSENVVRKMDKLSEKDQKKLMTAFDMIAENPSKGKPFNGVIIEAWENEKCKCGLPFQMILEVDDNEVHFMCRNGILLFIINKKVSASTRIQWNILFQCQQAITNGKLLNTLNHY